MIPVVFAQGLLWNKMGLWSVTVDKCQLVQILSPDLFAAAFSSFEGLFEHMQLLVEFNQLLPLCTHLSDSM